ncbi:hypothetical protein ASPACDRAFT_53171 [Aspergillus aculeatus ATCC 16872]|uniref:RING-type domain-containing protein n=1 Tax=Aspergillus aculeatus (strain ATCC 16872 / CBS 172.66 / WB 5094) TaxID=690307 RepID=A0A1L9WSE2_ASPA1|nr:uncharacterized protein ASPACDRAFT_53171 [Aspergillus aculeatus ATCC 16872]OJJ99038.1 hypothetical protein ASPACDRAFT_53171 [Aspergillus aculeatus ATCC 16872]
MIHPRKRSCAPQPGDRAIKKAKRQSDAVTASVCEDIIDLTLNDTDDGNGARDCAASASIAEATTLTMRATASDDGRLPGTCTAANLSFQGNLVRIHVEGVERNVAILVCKPLPLLLSRFAITLQATICGRAPKSNFEKVKHPKGKAATSLSITTGVRFYSLRIIVYGSISEKERVGEFLAAEAMFLQHPHPSEIKCGVQYLNPQYLLPPGSETMPSPDQLSISTCCVGSARPGLDVLTEEEKSAIYRIFNTTNASGDIKVDIKPSPRLTTALKRHQVEALVMMIEKEEGIFEGAQFPSMWVPFTGPDGKFRYQNIVTKLFELERPVSVRGGILADEMGLGKTLSSLALICHSLDRREQAAPTSIPRGTLIVTPKSTIYGWESQIARHICPRRIKWLTYHGSDRHQWHSTLSAYDVVLMTYDTLRAEEGRKDSLLEYQWERVILDEAHRIRNPSSKTFHAVHSLHAQYRWCLTGTPIQNRLEDYGALLSFIRVPPFESANAFNNLIIGPASSKQTDSLDLLRKVVSATCLRRTKLDYAATLCLPQKSERIERVQMEREDREIYEFFKRFSYLRAAKAMPTNTGRAQILVLIGLLRLICNHGAALLPEAALKVWREQDDTSLAWKALEAETRQCAVCIQSVPESRSEGSQMEELGCGHCICETCAAGVSQTLCPKCEATPDPSPFTKAPSPLRTSVSNTLAMDYNPSAKVKALLHNITQRQGLSDSTTAAIKFVVFSHWTKMLDLIATALQRKGLSFRRIDGRSTLIQRKEALEVFGSDPECNIMLASIGAAGEGIDLTVANSIHIVEPHWNPMAEAQAIDRVHRIGQKRDVEVVRYIVRESIESYVQWVQRDKLRLINVVLSPSDRCTKDITQERWKPSSMHANA